MALQRSSPTLTVARQTGLGTTEACDQAASSPDLTIPARALQASILVSRFGFSVEPAAVTAEIAFATTGKRS